ncbi:GDSL-type esterase/lipase family protein [Beijerinckia indica]|uniref:SGNH/GDSL hydrolase family protein n=1 Tax=Beijerinckia indica TaxID=533 RepID=UPI0002F2B58D|nr:SGNH family hydrolase [Beijerinckia indica]
MIDLFFSAAPWLAHLKRRLFPIIVTTLLLLVTNAPPTFAQNNPFDWFQNLFAPQPQPMPRHAPRKPHHLDTRSIETPKPRPVHPRPIATAPSPPKPSVPVRYRVAVVGDGLGQALAQGLAEALADRPDIAILRKTRDSTGLVREDFYNWQQAAQDLLTASELETKDGAASQKIDYAVILIGSNDRQSLSEDDKTYDLLSEPWQEAYGRRIESMAEAFHAHHVPLLWVGLPIVKSDKLAVDFSAFNTLYEDMAGKAGAIFVDVWEAFADEKGDYRAFGPGIDGQITRLRTSEGLYFTEAGARKLAHFVEGEIRRAYEEKTNPAAAPTNEAPSVEPPQTITGEPSDASSGTPAPNGLAPNAALPAPPPAKPAIGPLQSLTGPVLSHGGLLAQPDTKPVVSGNSAEQFLIKGRIDAEPTPKPGQASDFSWPRQ